MYQKKGVIRLPADITLDSSEKGCSPSPASTTPNTAAETSFMMENSAATCPVDDQTSTASNGSTSVKPSVEFEVGSMEWLLGLQ